MSLLVLQQISKRFSTGRRKAVVLKEVSLEVSAGEMVAVWGVRRSGRSTLLRIAAGVETPDEGVVCFDGRELARTRSEILGTQLGYCITTFSPTQGDAVIDYVAVGLIARGIPVQQAIARAHAALDRVGGADWANVHPRELHPHELVRAGIARALVTEPRLLLLDEPTNGVDLLQRDPIIKLIRSLADDGIAILMTVGESIGGADRVLVLDEGELRGRLPATAPVVPLRIARAEPSA